MTNHELKNAIKELEYRMRIIENVYSDNQRNLCKTLQVNLIAWIVVIILVAIGIIVVAYK